jgi:hypothetical protein
MSDSVSVSPNTGYYYHHSRRSASTNNRDASSAASSPAAGPSTALSWFNEHPVIATVLWALGTEIKEIRNYASNSIHENLNRHIVQCRRVSSQLLSALSETNLGSLGRRAMSFASSASSATSAASAASSSSSSSSQSQGRVLYSTGTTTTSGSGTLLSRSAADSGHSHSHHHVPVRAGSASPLATMSPYGFFVAITPPEEFYAPHPVGIVGSGIAAAHSSSSSADAGSSACTGSYNTINAGGTPIREEFYRNRAK